MKVDIGEMRKRSLLGIWDLKSRRLGLGWGIVFLQELKYRMVAKGLEKADLCFVNPDPGESPGTQASHGLRKISRSSRDRVLRALSEFSHIGDIYEVDSESDVAQLTGWAAGDTWPELKGGRVPGHDFESTLLIQKFHRATGCPARINLHRVYVERAKRFIADRILPDLCVTIHLKQVVGQDGSSNADLNAWKEFFGQADRNLPVKFLLLGDDPLPESIKGLPNVIHGRTFFDDLALDLALIQESFLFMGMASGLCNAAIFSAVPYVIFKNPGHHSQEMRAELGEEDRFPFSGEGQLVLRKNETAGLLFQYLESALRREKSSGLKAGYQ